MTEQTYFENSQWRLERRGIESTNPKRFYQIDADRLGETTERNGVVYYDWPLHMAEKDWVNLNEFIEVFDRGLDAHKGQLKSPRDDEMFKRSCDHARSIASGTW